MKSVGSAVLGVLLILTSLGSLAFGFRERHFMWFLESAILGVIGLLLLGYGASQREQIRPTVLASPPVVMPPEPKPTTQIVREEVIRKEVIVKMRCPYCNFAYDEILDNCPHCGARR